MLYVWKGEGTLTIIERALLSLPDGIPLDIYVPIIHILCVLYYYTVVGRRVVEICIYDTHAHNTITSN